MPSKSQADILKAMMKKFDVPSEIYLRKTSVSDAKAYLDLVTPFAEPCVKTEARKEVAMLMHFFSHQRFPSKEAADAMIMACVDQACAHSGLAVKLAFCPVDGLPAKAEYLTIAGLKIVLDKWETSIRASIGFARSLAAKAEGEKAA